MFQKRNELDVFQVLKTSLHVRAVAQQTGIAVATTQRVLKQLEHERAVTRSIQGKNHVFSRAKTPEATQYLYLTEHYQTLKLLENPFMRLLAKHVREHTDALVVVFGSYANQTNKQSSDVDLFIETKNQRVIQVIKEFSPKMSVQSGTLNPKSDLGQEILNKHVILQGVERFYQLYEDSR